MKQALFIGIDIGTQGTKAMLCREDGLVLDEAFCPSKLIRPDSATVYEEPEDIFRSVVTTISELTARAGEDSSCIRAIGMDAQMAGIMAIGDGYEAATPLDSWLDSRCADYTALIEKEAGREAVERSGGQIIHAAAPKMLWWKQEHPEAYSRIKKFVQPNSYVAGRLCGLSAEEGFMDYTFLHFNNFSDNRNLRYNKEMLSHFGMEEEKMPNIVSPETIVGTVTADYAAACGLPADVKVIAGCGDTAASSLGAGITRAGLAYDVAGTASVFACCTDRFVPDVENRTLMFSRSVCEGLYLPLAYISGGGLCLAWFAELVGKKLRELDREAEGKKADLPVFLPHFAGRTCPLDNRVSGAFLKLNPKTDHGDMHRAVMESIAFEYKSYLDILRRTDSLSGEPTVIGVGGGAKSAIFSQIKADVLGLRYVTPAKADSAPAAMAMLAAHAAGYRSEPLSELFKPDENGAVYLPQPDETRRYEPKAAEYLRLLDHYGDYMQ